MKNETQLDSFLEKRLIKYDQWMTKGQISYSSKVIPVSESLDAKQWIMPTEQVLRVLETAGSIALQDCECRTHYKRCEKPLEVCLLLNKVGDKAVAQGKARHISLEEATNVLKKANESGLVHMSLYMPDHEVFIKAQTNVASLKDAKKCIPWVYQITRNTIIDYYNKNKKNYLNTEISDELLDVSDNETINPEEIIQGLKPFIEALPKKYRDALLAIDITGLTQKEYSEQQGISLACSKSRLQRGRKMVREMLMDCCTFNSDIYGNVFDYEEINNHKKD